MSGTNVRLPTEQQWQWAAQGDDGRVYPWGHDWDATRCNNRRIIGKTTPVRAYEGLGDSPFKVVDLSGNVWEWCLTDYQSGSQLLNKTGVRVLRGGSWDDIDADNFRCDFCIRNHPITKNFNKGFRVSLS